MNLRLLATIAESEFFNELGGFKLNFILAKYVVHIYVVYIYKFIDHILTWFHKRIRLPFKLLPVIAEIVF